MKKTPEKKPKHDEPRAIQVRGLSKTYKTGFWLAPKVTQALRDLHLDVFEGEAFGLLGLNGAGKTTALKLVLGLLRPTSGMVQVLGGDISDRRTRARIGYLSELPYLSKQHTGRELLGYFGSLHGLGGEALTRRVDEVLELVGMTHAAKDRVSDYSKGMTQRIGIGQALIGRPDLLICDEPMSGLDPVGCKEMRDIFLELKKQGTTIFLNTHIMDEVERICDRIGILHEGVLKQTADVPEILRSSVPVDYWIDVDRSFAAKFSGLPFKGAVERQGGVQVTGMVLAETLALMTSRRAKVNSIRPLSSVIEAYFLRAIGVQGHWSAPERDRS